MSVELRSRTRELWKRFYLWAFGVLFVYSSYGTLLSLQSSINVQEGLGTAAVACICISGAILSILCVPVTIRRVGAKKCVWCGEIGHFIFTVINLHARWYTMLPASLLVGFGDVLLWSCMPIMNSFFAEIYAILRNEPGKDSYKSMFQSYFYGVFQMAKVAGNIVSYAILYGFESKEVIDRTNNQTVVNATTAVSAFSYCGRNDCQDRHVIENMINQYVPSKDWSIRMLLICLALLCITGIITHLIFIPDNLKIFGITEELEVHRPGENDHSNEPELPVQTTTVKHLSSGTVSDRTHMIGLVAKRARRRPENECAFILSSAKRTIRQVFTLNQALLIPMHLYAGMSYAIVTSDVSRSYTSCIFGVTWVPIHSMMFGIAASVGSYSVGALVRKAPRYFFVIGAAVLDATTLVLCQLWSPNNENQILVISIYIITGLTQGVWIPISQVLQVSISAGQEEIGSGINFCFYIIGIGIPFAWSTSMCVHTKIFCQLGVLAVTVLGYVALENRKRKQSSSTVVIGKRPSTDIGA